ncbi:class I SAM-dependent methyltransferase [Pararhodonellum marinum]|uniref:class I SAM-dependent methyltransferase n=1 Tax=Pararhodonellum marinum TaxID=2755358 RepID=UPI00188F4B76|nr:hypothetical protein [Pararhodonellum marinum]
MVIGFFLGILDLKDLHEIDVKIYTKRKHYRSDKHNKAPLFNWEREAIQEYFSKGSRILIIAVGGGREAYNLFKLGYEVHPYEYNEELRQFGNDFFLREGMPLTIGDVKRDAFPNTTLTFDGIIIGWGAYTHIKGRDLRITHLKQAYELLNPEGFLMISFWPWSHRYLNLNRIHKIGNFFSRLSGNNKVELGDALMPEFCHFYKQEEIELELQLSGLKVVKYSEEEYGHAVAYKPSRKNEAVQ